MFSCKVCKERLARLEDAQKQIEFLKKQLSPNNFLPSINYEANRIMDGGDTVATAQQADEQEKEKLQKEIDVEAMRLLTGSY